MSFPTSAGSGEHDFRPGRDGLQLQQASRRESARRRLALQMILPRPGRRDGLGKIRPPTRRRWTELAFSGPQFHARGRSRRRRRAVIRSWRPSNKKTVAGVANPRGTTRIIVVGDSIFLGNHQIEAGANRDFLGYAVNWLLDRPQLLEGIGPRPVTEFRLKMTRLPAARSPTGCCWARCPARCCSSAGWSGWREENNELENHRNLVCDCRGAVRVHLRF